MLLFFRKWYVEVIQNTQRVCKEPLNQILVRLHLLKEKA